jgi:hypothetical protein
MDPLTLAPKNRMRVKSYLFDKFLSCPGNHSGSAVTPELASLFPQMVAAQQPNEHRIVGGFVNAAHRDNRAAGWSGAGHPQRVSHLHPGPFSRCLHFSLLKRTPEIAGPRVEAAPWETLRSANAERRDKMIGLRMQNAALVDQRRVSHGAKALRARQTVGGRHLDLT